MDKGHEKHKKIYVTFYRFAPPFIVPHCTVRIVQPSLRGWSAPSLPARPGHSLRSLLGQASGPCVRLVSIEIMQILPTLAKTSIGYTVLVL